MIRPRPFLPALALLLLGAALPSAAPAQEPGAIRMSWESMMSQRPVGQRVVVRVAWGYPMSSSTAGCTAFVVGKPGSVPQEGGLPDGLFVQIAGGNLGLVQGLAAGDQVDVTGAVGWATCASARADAMGWLAILPSTAIRVARAGEPAPPEPGSTATVGTTGAAATTGTPGTAAPEPAGTPAAEEPKPGYEATVRLADGNVLRGRVVDENLDELTLLVAGNKMVLAKSGIARVERVADGGAAGAGKQAEPASKKEEAKPPPKSAAEKEREQRRAQAAVKTFVGAGLLVPAAILIPNGAVALGGGIAWETGGPTWDLPPNLQLSFRAGTWPAIVAVSFGVGVPAMIVGIKLMEQGIPELQALDAEEAGSAALRPVRQRRARVLPWFAAVPGAATGGLAGRF